MPEMELIFLRLCHSRIAPPGFLSFYKGIWWTWGGSNPRPHRCERCALPTELHAHCAFYSNKRA